MARKEKVGSGITAVDQSLYDITGKTPGDVNLARASFRAICEAVERNGGPFGAVSEGARLTCEGIRDAKTDDQNKEDFNGDSPKDFANRILQHLERAADCVANGQADMAAGFAFQAGQDWERALMKWRWEPHALRGEVIIRGASEGGKARRVAMYPRTKKILEYMAQHIDAGESIANAARLVFVKGGPEHLLGASAEANRKLWSRHRKK